MYERVSQCTPKINQNAETSVAAEPFGRARSAIRCKFHKNPLQIPQNPLQIRFCNGFETPEKGRKNHCKLHKKPCKKRPRHHEHFHGHEGRFGVPGAKSETQKVLFFLRKMAFPLQIATVSRCNLKKKKMITTYTKVTCPSPMLRKSTPLTHQSTNGP